MMGGSGIFLIILLTSSSVASAGEDRPPTRSDTYTSVDAFAERLRNFHPSASNCDLSSLFHATEHGQLDDPETFTPVSATKLSAVDIVWQSDEAAVVFAKATPPTKVAGSVVGVVFILEHGTTGWRITNFRRFVSFGKYAEVVCALTSQGESSQKVKEEDQVILTITIYEGGRGYSYSISHSFRIVGGKAEEIILQGGFD